MSLANYVGQLENACLAAILFQSPRPLSAAQIAQWKALTGTSVVTSEQLVNFIRSVLDQIPVVPEPPGRTPLMPLPPS